MSEHETGAEHGTSESQTGEAGPVLPFDAWAALSARLMNLAEHERLDVLDEHEVDPGDWTACDEHHGRELAGEVAQGRMDRAEVYARMCVAEMDRRRKQDEGAAPEPPEPDAAAPAPEPGTKIGAPLEAPLVETPSFLQPNGAAPPVPRVAGPPAELATTAPAFELPSAFRTGALPFRKAAAPSPPATPAEPRPPRPSEAPGSTMPLDATMPLGTDLMRAALPFEQAGPKPQAFPRMPLQTYAALCAELAVFPNTTAAVLAKYAVAGDAARAALDQDWHKRFDEHPETREEWERLAAEHRARLEKQAR
jgi:hypothetical protein